ncbi:T. brucei spp.-specific protein [Trypanosoma brucei gambiense DAL972]|uniref:T. brucei spp.-specific protein n=1 Tax=Trypanosoma brucei gambiense (strain MHOM/CI/86/DAL972) TaxID=679716 RepID=D0A6X2_TRYB9|nr:T. brucei spp.-specific protein [Trypanosoma brucei gambiense DAL972]CBH17423.1 T. brucei spp.-specific protein [Trypanosoma brucei gambiense DAL972]|eukprot:XP_011779687.1 T. brucei spp.-specific protein [Trypanosoma brucei gambiense DAL972]
MFVEVTGDAVLYPRRAVLSYIASCEPHGMQFDICPPLLSEKHTCAMDVVGLLRGVICISSLTLGMRGVVGCMRVSKPHLTRQQSYVFFPFCFIPTSSAPFVAGRYSAVIKEKMIRMHGKHYFCIKVPVLRLAAFQGVQGGGGGQGVIRGHLSGCGAVSCVLFSSKKAAVMMCEMDSFFKAMSSW